MHIHHPKTRSIILALVGLLSLGYIVFEYAAPQSVSSQTVDDGTIVSVPIRSKQLPIRPAQLAVQGTCVDSDGLHYSVPGQVTVDVYGVQSVYTDSCKAQSYFTLQEQVCESGLRKVKEYRCPLGCSLGACNATGTVFIGHTFDTEASDGNMDVYQQDFSLADYGPGSMIYRVMNEPTYIRTWYKDSFGQSPKYTWFLLAQTSYCKSKQQDCAMVHSVMRQFTDQIQLWGDELALHYHTADWSDRNGDGIFHWNQLLSMNGSQNVHGTDIESAERIWAYLILEQHFYTSMFRSGWAWEDNDFSNWLDDVAPFDYSNLSPLSNTKVLADRNGNIFDWRRAPQSWTPYHPSDSDYQMPGDQKRWQFRIMTSGSAEEYRKAFVQASAGENVLVETVAHSYNGGLLLESNSILKELAKQFPQVKYRFVTTLEGTQRVLGIDDHRAPLVSVTHVPGSSVVAVTSDEPLYTFPYGAVLTAAGDYLRAMPVDESARVVEGHYHWSYDLASFGPGVTFAAGGSDPAGNTFVTDTVAL